MPDAQTPGFEAFPESLALPVRDRLATLAAGGFTARLWQRDPTLWKSDPAHVKVASNRLGWLGSVGPMQASAGALEEFARAAISDGLRGAVLLGMGGSSLCPEVFATIFRAAPDAMGLIVLDTTDPASILSAEAASDPASTLYLVSSKSGGTVETSSLYRHFRARVEASGVRDPGSRFVAITDPGSPLEALAREEGFRRCFANPADIGGRYSALSYFGLVPAALLGMDVPRLLDRASRMAATCGPGQPPSANPGVRLGAILGEAALAGRDKLTLLLSPEIASFGVWVEQLVAESTGKEGRGILPIEGETPGRPESFGPDRIVVYLRLSGGDNRITDAAAAAFREASHPLVRLDLDTRWEIGGEFLRWEIATATAGAVLGVDPFDEPNVKESKDNTTRLLSSLGAGGSLPPEAPLVEAPRLAVYADAAQSARLRRTLAQRGWPESPSSLLAALLSEPDPLDYVSIQAYIDRSAAHEAALASMRTSLREALRRAVTLGYGPRFLHSTGQYHKGGPDRGIFLQVTADDARDLPVPGSPWSFGVLKAAQARGDFEAIAGRGRKALRIHLRGAVAEGLRALSRALDEGLHLLRGGRS